MNENKILLVDDCGEIRSFLKSQLEPAYKVLEAANGIEGWQVSTSEHPDLIITGVMMPLLNGYDLCSRLKNDERTCHIPVIMLTGQATLSQQLRGLESGVDIYLTKPCNMTILHYYIRNLLRRNQNLKQHYSREIPPESPATDINSKDKNFLIQLTELVEANLSRPDFTIPKLTREIGMSRAVLYKRLKASADTSLGEFIKSARLKKAATLLIQQERNIAEVAWEVGFSERKYFSKEFKKYFGKSPSEFTAATQRNSYAMA